MAEVDANIPVDAIINAALDLVPWDEGDDWGADDSTDDFKGGRVLDDAAMTELRARASAIIGSKPHTRDR